MLDDDVATDLARLRRLRGGGLMTLIDRVLRRGLQELAAEREPRQLTRTRRMRRRAEKRSAFRHSDRME